MTDIQFINLTPHIINLQKFDGTTLELPPSGTVARVEEARATARMIGDMGVSLASYGEVVNLPAPKPWTCYIVSSLVLAAVPERPDVFAPGPAIRNEAGQVIGANGLSCTPSYARLNPVDEPAHPVADDDDDDPQPVPVIGGFIEANKARTAVVLAKARELASKQGQWVSRDQFTEKQLFDLEHTRLQTVTEGRWHNVHKWGTAREGYVYTSGPIGDGKLKQCDTTFEVTYLHEACNVMVSIAPATQWHY